MGVGVAPHIQQVCLGAGLLATQCQLADPGPVLRTALFMVRLDLEHIEANPAVLLVDLVFDMLLQRSLVKWPRFQSPRLLSRLYRGGCSLCQPGIAGAEDCHAAVRFSATEKG